MLDLTGGDAAALTEIRAGSPVTGLLEFPELREIVGFDAYDAEAERYRG